MTRNSFPYGWSASALLVAAIASTPVAAILWSFVQSGGTVLQDTWAAVLPAYVFNSLALMTLVGGLTFVIGVSTAWIVTAMQFPGRRALAWLLALPLAAPAYIVAYLYTDLLEYAGPVQSAIRAAFDVGRGEYWFPEIRSLLGAGVVMSVVLYPYVYLLARASFAAQSRSQFSAARTLGLSPSRAFFRVVLPGARPAIVGGLTLVLMETLADFGVADYFAIPTFSTGIFRTWLAVGDRDAAMKIAGVMLVVVILLVIAEEKSRRGRVASLDRLSAAPPPFILSPLASVGAIAVCSVPILAGFVAPLAVLLSHAIAVGDGQSSATLASYAGNSVKVAVMAAAIASAVAVLLAYAVRASRRRRIGGDLVGGAVRISTLGYALPGALLAVGLLAPIGALDRSIAIFLRDTFGFNQGLLISGTIVLLVYALVVRFLTVSYNSVSGGLEKISPSMDAAARALGANQWRLLREIHIPLLTPSLATGAAIVFIDVMRELPATLILRPFDFETLATRVYRLASDERIAEASTAALIIIALGILPVALIQRHSAR